MADFVPIVQGLGGIKTCDLCGKQVSLGDTTRQTSMAADGITLTSSPPTHMHANCLRETLLWAAKSMHGCGGQTIVAPPQLAHPGLAEAMAGVSELSARPLPVKGTPPEVQG